MHLLYLLYLRQSNPATRITAAAKGTCIRVATRITAAALTCYNGQIQGRLILDKNEILRAKKLGIRDLNKKYNINDMVKGDIIFCATGVTDSELVKGIVVSDTKFEVNTLVLHQSQKIIKKITNSYKK